MGKTDLSEIAKEIKNIIINGTLKNFDFEHAFQSYSEKDLEKKFLEFSQNLPLQNMTAKIDSDIQATVEQLLANKKNI